MRFIIRFVFTFFCLISVSTWAQQELPKNYGYLGFDVYVGMLGNSNSEFPEHGIQKSLFFNVGQFGSKEPKYWRYHLNGPKTGISLGFTDLGNKDALGYAYSVMPYAEFSLFPKTLDGFSLWVSMGGSYMTRRYNKETNPYNKGVSTRLNWSYNSFLYYTLLKNRSTNWRMGVGYAHHSNGHTRKPNRGYNSVLWGTSINFKNEAIIPIERDPKEYPKVLEWYYTGRFGVGQNSFSDIFNDKEEVFAVAFSAGKIINRTFKFGVGLYYNFYRHYYNYIKNEETLVRTQEPQFTESPIISASALGISGSAELLLSHVGMELNVGLNYYKPFYKIDWQLNEGYTYFPNGEEEIVLGELDGYYNIKRLVSSRMGLKYYLLDTDKAPKHNFFVGAFINANLGQADFSEFTFGYVRRFNL
ncbi:acyloxyacyl hydrolase [Flagellimonas zhangzhouensis]|uniref:Lipid A 3-O-deacylase (PagL) n=1 Tax=Flagellimonas zhangzhouensis TaxID=1073328 RepID=A0A1H2XBH9_9FLAO|nr:acyloxyacyl hydrolase [Allomuricauda zhangzhouensis]SDQ30561.1 Lipid A 3-O-deacylase (PagL) [Allomuricauda zhangzhouensis]SDW90253.1 Lipid A 3-O-deacylase (PagL) [Allomuricauda zhangzhouensis]